MTLYRVCCAILLLSLCTLIIRQRSRPLIKVICDAFRGVLKVDQFVAIRGLALNRAESQRLIVILFRGNIIFASKVRIPVPQSLFNQRQLLANQPYQSKIQQVTSKLTIDIL